MNATELLERARAADVQIAVRGGELCVKTAAPPPDGLLDALRAHKPLLLAALAERRREAAVTDAWDRLCLRYERCGRPQGWLTTKVREEEAKVERSWLEARDNPAADARFHANLQAWFHAADTSIEVVSRDQQPKFSSMVTQEGT